MDQMKMINSSDIRKVLTFDRLLPATEECLKAFSVGPQHTNGAVQPLRSRLNVQKHNGTLFVMPGYLLQSEALATKIVSEFPDNASVGKNIISAIIVLLDSRYGHIKAVLEGNSITELRTATSSGIASKYFASEEIRKISVLGSGVQGASHARVHHYLFKPCLITIWSRSFENAERLVKTLVKEGIDAIACKTVEKATEDADIINTCTMSEDPILHNQHVKPGAHINVVGANSPNMRELDPSIMKTSVIFADSREAALVESGDVVLSGSKILAEIGEVISGKAPSHRLETTVYKSCGIAVLDATAAHLAYQLLYEQEP